MRRIFTPAKLSAIERCLIGLFALALLMACQERSAWRLTDVSGKLPGLDFNLTDMDGLARQGADFRGKVILLFTGFTHCPGICPATLARLATVLESIDDSTGKIQVLFVSLDPERDSPAQLKNYVSQFGPWFIGLTGSKAQLDALVQRYFLSYRKEMPVKGGDYDVIHSDVIVIFDRNGNARLLARSMAPPEDLKADLQRLLNP